MSKAGDFGWYDLMVEDVEGAKAFYSQLLGWELQPFEHAPADDPYDMWIGAEGPVGGLMRLNEEAKRRGAPPHWLAYTHVESVQGCAQRVRELGGEVLLPATEIPGTDAGSFAILRDPQGAVFGVLSGPPEGEEKDTLIGRFSWHELAAVDHEAAFAFYSDIFGWKKGEAMDMGPMGIYQQYGNGGRALGGMFDKPAEAPVPYWMFYVSVEDCDASADKAKELGATVLNAPMEVPGGDRVCMLRDPGGAAFALHAAKKG